jgi:predicted membrane metal-binding protein
MNMSSLSAADRQIVIGGAVVTVVAVVSFLDPSGSWGAVMILSLLGGLGAMLIGAQAQVAPTMKLPAARGISLLVVGALAAGGFVLAMVTFLSYILGHLLNIFVLLMVVGLIAGLYLLWIGWQAYQAESGSAAAAPASPAPMSAPPQPAGEPPVPPAEPPVAGS